VGVGWKHLLDSISSDFAGAAVAHRT
jgi:hypothetical protein